MDDSPDYQSYSLEQLYDVARHIDREKHPDRYAILSEEIIRKEQTLSTQPSPSSPTDSFASIMTGFIVGGFLGLAVGVCLGFAAMFLLIVTGPSSAKANLDGATGLGGIIFIFAFAGGIIGAIAGIQRALK